MCVYECVFVFIRAEHTTDQPNKHSLVFSAQLSNTLLLQGLQHMRLVRTLSDIARSQESGCNQMPFLFLFIEVRTKCPCFPQMSSLAEVLNSNWSSQREKGKVDTHHLPAYSYSKCLLHTHTQRHTRPDRMCTTLWMKIDRASLV